MTEMTLERACEVLNKHKFRGVSSWRITRTAESSGRLATRPWIGVGSTDIFYGGVAVAVAEKLERDAPPAEDSAALIEAAIHDASRDIGEWKQLGRRWMDESPDYTRDPKCPTDVGMRRSSDVQYSLAMALKALRGIARGLAVSEETPCSTPSPSTVVPPDQATWDILCAYLADEDHQHGSGVSEGRLAEILGHRLGWGREEVRRAWFDAVARGNALIEEDHRRKAPLVQAEFERMRARAISSKARSGEAPPSSSGGTGSEAG